MSPRSSEPSTPVSIARNRIHSAFKSLASPQYSRFLTQLTPPASPLFQSEKRIAGSPTRPALEAPQSKLADSLPELDEAVINSVKWVSMKEVSMKEVSMKEVSIEEVSMEEVSMRELASDADHIKHHRSFDSARASVGVPAAPSASLSSWRSRTQSVYHDS